MNSDDIVNKIIEEDKQQVPPEVVDLTQARETNEGHNSLDSVSYTHLTLPTTR